MPTPNLISPQTFPTPHSDITSLACGSGHTVTLSSTGAVYTWGRGDDGRLGHGDNGWKYIPRPVAALSECRVSVVTCGSYHTAAVGVNGELWTWGGGMYGKLGHGGESGLSKPRIVEGLRGFRIVAVACGSRHTAAVSDEGGLWTWGDKENGVTGHGEVDGHQYTPRPLEKLRAHRIKAISACGFHSAVLAEDGGVWTWGEGKFGRLGHGTEANASEPTKVEALSENKMVKVACGGFHSGAITESGDVYTWGGGEHGQLGHGEKVNKTVPTLITSRELKSKVVVSITCGWSHSVALTGCGKVYTWGNGDHGKLGHGGSAKVSTPKMVEALGHLRVVKIASYNEHTAALCQNGLGLPQGRSASVSAGYVSDLRSLVANEEFADVVFKVGGGRVPAHRAILAARCPHFNAMFNSGMRESFNREVDIPDTDFPTFLHIVEFLYTDAVLDLSVFEAIPLFCCADLYNLVRLKETCAITVRRGLIPGENAASLLQLAHDSQCADIKEICMDAVVSKFDVVSKSTGMRELVKDHELMMEVLERRNMTVP